MKKITNYLLLGLFLILVKGMNGQTQKVEIIEVAKPLKNCGQYQYAVKFKLANASANGGYIVQKVKTDVYVTDCNDKVLTNFSQHTVEAWKVLPNSNSSPLPNGVTFHDVFRNSKKNLDGSSNPGAFGGKETKGKVSIRAEVVFIENPVGGDVLQTDTNSGPWTVTTPTLSANYSQSNPGRVVQYHAGDPLDGTNLDRDTSDLKDPSFWPTGDAKIAKRGLYYEWICCTGSAFNKDTLRVEPVTYGITQTQRTQDAPTTGKVKQAQSGEYKNGSFDILIEEGSFPIYLIYPNPVSEKLTIQLENETKDVNYINIRVYNLIGEAFLKQNAYLSKETNIDLSVLSKGSYLVVIEDTTNGTSLTKIIQKE